MGAFFGGIVLIACIDRIIPAQKNPHEAHAVEEMRKKPGQDERLLRMGLLTALAIGIHNFPEGLATFFGALSDPAIGIAIAVAIAIHNIPEGICTSASYFHASGNRSRAFLLSCSTAVPIVVGYFMARYVFESISAQVVGVLIAGTAGLMIYITVDELIPNSCAGDNHQTIFSFIMGVVLVILLQLV